MADSLHGHLQSGSVHSHLPSLQQSLHLQSWQQFAAQSVFAVSGQHASFVDVVSPATGDVAGDEDITAATAATAAITIINAIEILRIFETFRLFDI